MSTTQFKFQKGLNLSGSQFEDLSSPEMDKLLAKVDMSTAFLRLSTQD